MKRLLLFGGTFSPPHLGHLHALRECRRLLQPDLCLVMPANLPPHKTPARGDSPRMRYDMTCLAFAGEEGYGTSLLVSDWELNREEKSYTVLTLAHLRIAYPDYELILLCGTDMFVTLDRWYRAEDIFHMAQIALVRRESDAEAEALIAEKAKEYTAHFGARLHLLHADVHELSSTAVRKALAEHLPAENLIPPAVADYIRRHRLYLSPENEV